MSNPGHLRPGALRPGFTVLPDGRAEMVVFIALNDGNRLDTNLRRDWGLLYSEIEGVDCTGRFAHLAGLRLMGGQRTQQVSEQWVWVRIYQELPETGLVEDGPPFIWVDENNRRRLRFRCVGLGTVDWTPTTAGTVLDYEGAAYALVEERVTPTGTAFREVFREYRAGTEDLLQLGHDRDITRPDGQRGIVRTYDQLTFATWTRGVKGSEITVAGVVFVLHEEDKTETMALRLVTRTYLEKGFTTRREKTYPNGFVTTTVTVYASGTVPTVSGGTLAIKTVDDTTSATPTYTYVFVSNGGVFSRNYGTRTDGLRTETVVSLGLKTTPSGEVIDESETDDEGVPRYTVTAMQAANGGGPETASLEIERVVHFDFPGRARVFRETVGNDVLDVYKSPPERNVPILATVTITYSTDKEIGDLSALTPPYWQPTDSVTVRVKMRAFRGAPVIFVEELPGYRIENGIGFDTGTITAPSGCQPQTTLYGRQMLNGSIGTITLSGGPGDPSGTEWTLEISNEPAFTTKAGMTWYRKVVVTATPPEQNALPSLGT